MRSLKKSRDFKEVYNNRRSVANRLLVLYIKGNECGTNRLGVSISRKVGCAVVRNKIKRRIKEAIKTTTIKPGYDLVIVARASAAESSFDEIRKSIENLLDKQKIQAYEC